jgi:glycosyltransferase involved in cell wall biosynthesis
MSSASATTRPRPPDFLVFSDDWGEHPSSCQHIFRQIALEHRVLWVNTIGMRNPTFTLRDARKIMRKVAKMAGARSVPAAARTADGYVTVCQPLMLPGIRSTLVRALNARSVTLAVRTRLQSLGIDDPIVLSTVPNAADYPDLLAGRQVIYYCVDDFSLWPGLDAALVLEMESRLIARADSLIAVSHTLRERLAASGKPTHLLTHGVDVKLFSTPAAREHSVLTDIPRPRAGFFGLIDGRMDWELIVSLAQRMPDTSFVLAGPVDASAGNLPQIENLHVVGPMRYTELPQLIAGLDLLILPYRTGALAAALSPLKLNEYLATGKPVISAPIAAASEWADTLMIARTPAEWAMFARHALGSQDQRGRQIPVRLVAQSWASKAQELLSLCGREDCADDCATELSRSVAP